MTMPRVLTWFRHGLSESNKAKKLAKKKTPHPNERALMKAHTSERRLDPEGVRQANTLGAWLLKDMEQRARVFGHGTFEHACFNTSVYIRTMETALETKLPVIWQPDPRLCERNWGTLDQMTYGERNKVFAKELKNREEYALFWAPRDGESLLDVRVRLWQHFDMLHRQCSENYVYNSSHGETMWTARCMHEYWMPRELADRMIHEDKDWRQKIINCRVIQYTRQCSDDSPELASKFVRVRLVNPEFPDDPNTNLPWQPIKQREFDLDELRAYVNLFPHFLEDAV